MLSNIVIFTIKFICSDCITEWGQDLQFPASYNFNNNCMGRQIMVLQEHSILLWTVCQLLEKRVVHLGYGNVKKKILKVSRAWTKGHCSQILIMKRNILPSAGGTENPGTTPEGGNDLWVPCQAVHGKAEGLRNHVDWKELHDKKKKKLVCDKRKNDDFPCKTFFFLKLGWEIEGVSAASCSFPSQRGSNELSLWKCSTWNTQDQTNAGVRKAIHGCQTVRNVRTAP